MPWGYSTNDRFHTSLAAAAVNGTLSEPGGEPRLVTDTGNNLSVSNGVLRIIGAAGAGDPGLWYVARARTAGLTMLGKWTVVDATLNVELGFAVAQAGIMAAGYCFVMNADTLMARTGAVQPVVVIPVDGTEYKMAVVLRTAGAFFFVKSPGGYYEMVALDVQGGGTPVYPAISNVSASLIADNILVSNRLWIPRPMMSDGFSIVPDATDRGDNGYDGAHTEVALDSVNRAYYNGVSSYTNIQTAGMAAKFNGLEGSLIIRAKVADAYNWIDETERRIVEIYADATNYLSMSRDTVDNQIIWSYKAGVAAVATDTKAALGAVVDFFTMGMTWSDTANRLETYYDGATEGGAACAGVWAGAPTVSVIGAETLVPATVWNGWLSDCILVYGLVATAAQMTLIHNYLDAGTLTVALLDGMFGQFNWSWWRLDESYYSDGLGHAEGVAGGLGSGGGGKRWDNWTWHIHPTIAENYPISTELHTAANCGGNNAAVPLAGDANATVGWAADATGGVLAAAAAPAASVGGFEFTITGNALDNGALADAGSLPTVAHTYYHTTFDVYKAADAQTWKFAVRDAGDTVDVAVLDTAFNTGGAYQSMVYVWRSAGINERLQFVGEAAAAGTLYVDNISVREISNKNLFQTRQFPTFNVMASAKVTVTGNGVVAGVVINLDDPDDPQNYMIAYHDGTNCKLDKCVNGVITPDVITGAAAYIAGFTVDVYKSGTTVRLYYNKALIGFGVVANEEIISNCYHGIFSNAVTGTLNDFFAYPTGTNNEHRILDAFEKEREL